MSAKKIASEAFNEQLIHHVSQYPFLYNPLDPLYGISSKKREVWLEMAAVFGERADVLKTRWRTLRDRYTKERRRIQEGGVCTFSHYKQMEFLEHFVGDARKILTPGGTKRQLKDEASEPSPEGSLSYLEHTELGYRSGSCGEQGEVPNADMSSQLASITMNSSMADPTTIRDNLVNEPPLRDSTVRDGPIRDGPVRDSTVREDLESGVPQKRRRDEAPLVSSWEIKEALLRSAEALNRITEKEAATKNSTAKNSDEFFVEYVLSALREIDSESRAHARIAIIQALAQFQT